MRRDELRSDRLAKLASEANELPPTDPYVVLPCVGAKHRRVNDVLVVDPHCDVCLGLGIVRVLRASIPVVQRRRDEWVRADDVVSQLSDVTRIDD